MNLLVLGPQGAGKGTQAKRIAAEYELPHVSTGDMFRAAIAAQTPLGKRVEPILAGGALVPDGVTVALIRERLAEPDAAAGFALDGFPRNLAQAAAFDDMLREMGRHFSVNRMLTMDSVKLRLEREQPLSFLEFNYMLMQAADFLELNRRHGCTLQFGGSEQWGNIVNGIDLIRRVTAAKLALPSMLITGYPSPETISEALLVGASDYLAKPFDMVHVQSRARTLLDRTLSALVFDRILRDLATLLQPPRSGGELFADLKGELGASQRTIDEALSVVLLDDLLFDLLALTRQLTAAGLRAKVHSAEAALELVVSASPPHAVVVDLARPEALALILALRTANPQVEVLAVTQEVDIVRALGAVQAGAADFVLIGVDDLAMITTRIRRIVARSRRRRMYLNLIAALHRRAVTSDPLLAGHFLSMVPPADERYIRERPAPGVTATDAQFDLDAYAER